MIELSSRVDLALYLYEIICHIPGGGLEGGLQINHILLCVLDSDNNIVGPRRQVDLGEHLANSHIHLHYAHISLSD